MNDSFYANLGGSGSGWPPWAMTALFYIAVHEIQAFIIRKNVQPAPRDHATRKGVLRTNWPSLAVGYQALYQRSVEARYDCKVHQPHQLQFAEVLLAQVRTEIANN